MLLKSKVWVANTEPELPYLQNHQMNTHLSFHYDFFIYSDFNAAYEIPRNLDPGRTHAIRTPSLRRLEATVTNIESFMEPIPVERSLSKSQHLSLVCPSIIDDTLSDVDLENFDPDKKIPNESRLTSSSVVGEKTETVSLSNFHNVGDALLYFSNRLESYLKTNLEENADGCNRNCLKENISDLKRELERYVDIINEKKENELRKFSENMSRHSKILHLKNAFSRQEKLKTNIYETLRSSHFKYAIADNESLRSSFRYSREQEYSQDRFVIQGCFDDSSYYSDCSSVECYTMLIKEERPDRLLNDAPHPRYYGREKISLIFRDPDNVVNQWKNFQTPNKDRTMRSLWSKRYSLWPRDSESFCGFTLDSRKNEILELKLHEESRMR